MIFSVEEVIQEISKISAEKIAWEEIIDSLIQLSIEKKNPRPPKSKRTKSQSSLPEINVETVTLTANNLDQISTIVPSSNMTKYSESAFRFCETPGATRIMTPMDSSEENISPENTLKASP